jgi:hypothetical protein
MLWMLWEKNRFFGKKSKKNFWDKIEFFGKKSNFSGKIRFCGENLSWWKISDLWKKSDFFSKKNVGKIRFEITRPREKLK